MKMKKYLLIFCFAPFLIFSQENIIGSIQYIENDKYAFYLFEQSVPYSELRRKIVHYVRFASSELLLYVINACVLHQLSCAIPFCTEYHALFFKLAEPKAHKVVDSAHKQGGVAGHESEHAAFEGVREDLNEWFQFLHWDVQDTDTREIDDYEELLDVAWD